jgi:hypothetical protein
MSNSPGMAGRVATTVVLVAVLGCGKSETELAKVRGTVTLDGQALVDAKVEFQPVTPADTSLTQLSPSYGKTDARGRYKLMFSQDQEGAIVGTHVVRITTRRESLDDDGNEVVEPERLPPAYHVRSDLKRFVQAGSNTLDFALELKPSPKAANQARRAMGRTTASQ